MIMMNNMTTMTTMAMAMLSAMALVMVMAAPTPAEEEGAELVRAAPRREERARGDAGSGVRAQSLVRTRQTPSMHLTAQRLLL
jgi:hypothetical protein